MMNFVRNLVLLSILSFLAASTAPVVLAEHGQWTQFLGPDRNGVTDGESLIQSWPETDPKVLWRASGGVGMSGVAVTDQLAITLWNSSKGQLVVALDRNSGEPAWKTVVAPNYENSMGDGPRATPTISRGQVFAFTGEGLLVALNLADGKINWTTDVFAGRDARPAEYGMASSPLVVGDLVIVTAGGPNSAVTAIHTADGKVRWSAVDGAPGYSSPALLPIAGEQHLVTFTGQGVVGLNPNSGEVLWTYPFKTPYDCNTATPISVDGHVFISAGENHGCVMLEVLKSANNFQVNEVWSSVDVKSVLRNEWQTSALIDGHLYGFDNVGSAGPVTHLSCVNAKTGETVWRQNRFGKANLVAADGILWITTMKGEFVMVKATTAGYAELGRKKLFGKTRQAPAIDGGMAFIRDDAEVICIDIRR
ncbi:MAG: PQQ-binding-like beta-propeller repeat protein [Rubripirellula sp.]